MPIRSGRCHVLAATFLACSIAAPAMAAPPATAAAERGLPSLRPGQFLWLDDAQIEPAAIGGLAATGVSMTVSLAEQRAYVYRDGGLIGVTTVSTGSSGRETPVGDYTILQKKTFHRSNLYSNAPMPFMQRLTWSGIALHAGSLPGYPASHGCIRLPAAFAKQFYAMTELGGSVSVVARVHGEPADYAPFATAKPLARSPRLIADTRAFGRARPLASPILIAETHNLGGASFDTLTMGGEPPEALRIADRRGTADEK